MEIVNLTPHIINMNDGRAFLPSGMVAKVQETLGFPNEFGFIKVDRSNILGLPKPQDGVFYIVSSIVFAETKRKDILVPATRHPETIRDEKGHIVSVPCLYSH